MSAGSGPPGGRAVPAPPRISPLARRGGDEPSPSHDDVHLVALLSLPGMGPHRLGRLLEGRGPADAWEAIGRWRSARSHLPDGAALRGNAAKLYPAWAAAQRKLDPLEVWDAHHRDGIEVIPYGSARYPERLASGPEPPAVLFARGDLGALDCPGVAMVGTRRCTPYGLGVAREWAAALAAAGVSILSGLARGIDAAAHAGALEPAAGAPPVAVVGTGLDVVYPAANRGLWNAVAAAGLVLSEAPMGGLPEPWRFPARNRIIAGLADAVVVVESHDEGGALITAAEAQRRQVPVLAVPGSVRSSASAGTNRIIVDGGAAVAHPGDVLAAVSLLRPLGPLRSPARPVAVDEDEAAVLAAVSAAPVTVDHLAGSLEWPLGQVCVVVERLAARGLLTHHGGWLHGARG